MDFEWTVGPVNLGGSLNVLGQYSEQIRWNGWLCPHIDALSVVEVAEWLKGLDSETAPQIDWDGETLVVTDPTYAAEDPEYTPERIEPDADGFYALGAFSWIWSAPYDTEEN